VVKIPAGRGMTILPSPIYISHDSITSMANKVFDYDIASIRIRDEVGVEDHVLPALTSLLELELKQGGLGGNLYLESIKNQIACIYSVSMPN
jgi:AraC family transcriptional regulator